jgi:hypothetical protein
LILSFGIKRADVSFVEEQEPNHRSYWIGFIIYINTRISKDKIIEEGIMLLGWLVPSIGFWINGYLGNKESSNFSGDFKRIKSPAILYLFCGMPKSPNIPKGVIILNFLWQQIFGALFLVYGFFFDRYISLLANRLISITIGISPQFISYAAGFLVSFIVSGLIAYYFFRLSPYID